MNWEGSGRKRSWPNWDTIPEFARVALSLGISTGRSGTREVALNQQPTVSKFCKEWDDTLETPHPIFIISYIYIYKIESLYVCMFVCLLLGSGGVFFGVSSFGSVTMAAAQQWGNNGVVFSLGSVLRICCRGNIFLSIIIKYKIPGAPSSGVKWSGREAEIQPKFQKGEVVKSRHA
jgi:hypothetical protein